LTYIIKLGYKYDFSPLIFLETIGLSPPSITHSNKLERELNSCTRQNTLSLGV